MKVFDIELKMTIPNALSIFRLLLLPVFVTLYMMGMDKPVLQYWSFGILVLSGLTDLFDGLIARKFNQISDLGKVLDPIADKVTQVTVVICLAIQYRALIPLVVICFFKELGQAIGGLFLIRKGVKIRGAEWYGKVTTFVFYGVMALIVLLPDMLGWVRLLLIGLVAALMLFSFFSYMRVFLGIKKTITSDADKVKTDDNHHSSADVE